MKLFTSQSLSWATGGILGPTLPCQRDTKSTRDILVRVIRSDTNEPLDEIVVELAGRKRSSGESTQTTGAVGAGTVFFTDVAKDDFTVSVQLSDQQQTWLRIPPTQSFAAKGTKRYTRIVKVDVVPLLTLDPCVHHFAPSREVVDIDYTIRGLSDQNVYLRITSPHYPGDHVVYERAITGQDEADGDHSTTWDGKANRGALSGKWIHPLLAPYHVQIRCAKANNGGTAIRQVHVLYHGIAVEHGTWTPDGNPPNKVTHPVAWVQYRLNELGYFAGPVDDNKGPQTRRAMRRYGYGAPGYYRNPTTVDSIQTLPGACSRFNRVAGLANLQIGDMIHVTGGPNNNTSWTVYEIGGGTPPTWARAFGFVAANNDAGPVNVDIDTKETDDETHATLDGQLTNGNHARLIWEHDQMPAAGSTAKAYISHDYFYMTDPEFADPTGHVTKDREKLDPFQFPIEATLQLVSRDDDDGTGEGVEVHGEAVGPVQIEWLVTDPAEDTSVLPAHVVPSSPSRATNYINAAMVATREAATSADNCPLTNAGRRAAAHDNGQYFVIGNGHAPWTSQHVGTSVYVPVHQDANANPNEIGRSGAWFRGSYVAGDNFQITARIALARHTGSNASIVTNHQNLVDLSGRNLDTITDASTGTFTIWRTHHISAVLTWPAPNHGVDLAAVARHYAVAHCELPTDQHVTLPIQNLLSTVNDRDQYLDLVHHWMTKAGHASNRATMVFRNDGLYPYPLPVQPPNMNATNYKNLLSATINNFSNNDPLQMRMGAFLYSKVRARERAGAMVMRFAWHTAAYVRSDTWLLGLLKNLVWPYYHNTPKSCIGQGCGLGFLDNSYTNRFQDGFLYAHEVGHCRFMQHDEAVPAPGGSATPADHDTHDHNCVMSYPWFIASRPGLNWRDSDGFTPRFCGKCILKLRGWNPTDGALPVHS